MKYSEPEKLGIKSADIQNYIRTLEEADLSTHDLIIMRHGNIVFEHYWEPFNKDFLHRMYSVSKSFVSLAIGFCEQDGLIDLDAPIQKYFPDELKNQTDENIKNQTIRHMLMMCTAKPERGWFAARTDDRVKFYLENDLQASRPSGTTFSYDSTGSFVLGALVERVTGMELMEYLRAKCLDEIGFSKEAYMLKCPGGHSWGDSALICTAQDLLKAAMFCMNKGAWNGKQLLNKEYITLATTKQTANALEGISRYRSQGYGYQIWICYENSFLFNGMGCQFALCIPEKDIIMIYNGDNQGISDAQSIILDNFFKLVADKAEDGELASNPEEQETLREYCANLKLFAAKGAESSSMQEKINGVTYIMNKNDMGIEKIKFVFEKDGKGTFYYTNAQGDKQLPFGMLKNEFAEFPQMGYSDKIGSMPGNRLYKCAASAAWLSDRQLFIKVQIIDTYFGILNMNFGFREDGKIGVFMNKTAEDFLNEYQGFAGGTAE